jgi:hypothetical protein
MSTVPASGRSFETISRDDLVRLAAIERRDRADRFSRKPEWKELYAERLLCVALCQGAAKHFLNGSTGVNDFDVWTFYAEHPLRPFPPRWRLVHDFGDAKFGQSVDSPQYIGRRVDCISRSIPALVGEDPMYALRRYLSAARTTSAQFLRQSAVILLEPAGRLAEVVWRP